MDFKGVKIRCPICRSEEVELRMNKKEKPLVYCGTFGDSFNYNSQEAILFIKRVLEKEGKVDVSPRSDRITMDLDG